MTWVLYYAAVALAATGARLAAWWNPKVRAFVHGRKGWRDKLKSLPPARGPRIWFHVSSLGEFEQARPVIERLKTGNQYDIVLTFFSPSGYEIRKDYPHAAVMYLPLDLPGNATLWLEEVKPDLAVFVKYDFWPGYLKALEKNSVPFLVIAAHFTPAKRFNSWSIPPTHQLLKKSRMIFLQNGDHVDEIRRRGFTQVQVAGDTRIDRVTELPAEAKEKLPASLQAAPAFDLVAGSTWPEDEHLLLPVIEKLQLRTILAPHDVSQGNINRVCNALPADHIRYSQWQPVNHSRILVIDNIGVLACLYALGRIAYVGGGFGKNIHNILEPMAHGKPVIIGPAHQHFPEAVAMVRDGGAFSVSGQTDLLRVLEKLRADGSNEAGQIAGDYIRQHKGATDIIVQYIAESIPFASNS